MLWLDEADLVGDSSGIAHSILKDVSDSLGGTEHSLLTGTDEVLASVDNDPKAEMPTTEPDVDLVWSVKEAESKLVTD